MPVYMIRAGETEMVKIGWSGQDVEARRGDLQGAHYEELHTVRTIDGPRAVEGWLHRHFRTSRVRREWFRFHPEMLTISIDDVRPAAKRARRGLVALPIGVISVTQVIDAFGGYGKAQVLLGVSRPTLTLWEKQGIPPKRWRQIAELATRLEKPGLTIGALTKVRPSKPVLVQAAA